MGKNQQVMPRTLSLLLLLTLFSCSSKDHSQLSSSTSSDPLTVNRSSELFSVFENALAEKLFRIAVEDISTAPIKLRQASIKKQSEILQRNLNQKKLNTANRTQLRLFQSLARSTNDIVSSEHRDYYRTYLPPGARSATTVEALETIAADSLEKLHHKIRVYAQVSAGKPLRSLFDSIRENPESFFSEDESGRQRYLNEVVDTLKKMEELLPSFVDNRHNRDLSIDEILEDAKPDKQSQGRYIFYDLTDATLRLNIHAMDQLPKFELESAALYYGVPGLHTLNSASELYDVQSLITIPGRSKGWANYVISNLNLLPTYQHPNSVLHRSYVEAMLMSLAMIDIGLHTQQWSPEQSLQFALDSSPYPERRLRAYIEMIDENPGIYSAPLLVQLELLALKQMSIQKLQGSFRLKEFNSIIINSGPLPLEQLEAAIKQWILGHVSVTD
ncbi:MAG: DUF885 family protein [Pseudomonadales bacterium]